jgi:NAD(P)-dependent dehydrogenase (short-subunit alcohol dehydrogenase family)
MEKSTWLITCASSGTKCGLAEHVLERGDQVVLGARTTRWSRSSCVIPTPNGRRGRIDELKTLKS